MSATLLSKAEKSYIRSALLETPSLRADGRPLEQYRTIALETGVAPLANGSAKVSIGRGLNDGGGGTEIIAAVKLEVENIGEGEEGVDGGRVVCSVSCSPAAYANTQTTGLDDLSYDLTRLMHDTLGHPSLRPKNLTIIHGRKAWLLSLDLVVLSDSGNVIDALFIAARAALWDTKVPRTRSVHYRARKGAVGSEAGMGGNMDIDEEGKSGFDTRSAARGTDFELADYWDEGEVLDGRETWPISVTMNYLPSVSFLDATLHEETAVPSRVLFVFSTPSGSIPPSLQSTRLLGSGEITAAQLKSLVKKAEQQAIAINDALTRKLNAEDERRSKRAVDIFELKR